MYRSMVERQYVYSGIDLLSEDYTISRMSAMQVYYNNYKF